MLVNCRKWELYAPPKPYENVYKCLVQKYGKDAVFILSAGWGLVNAACRLPPYNISPSAKEEYAKITKRELLALADKLKNYNLLGDVTNESRTIYFFGGKRYIPLFCKLTQDIPGMKVIHYKCSEDEIKKARERCPTKRYRFEGYKLGGSEKRQQQTNWHYARVKDFMKGKIG